MFSSCERNSLNNVAFLLLQPNQKYYVNMEKKAVRAIHSVVKVENGGHGCGVPGRLRPKIH
jgi:hypothetical protein